ncbi:hypothetical protein [Desulfosporosinus hippei]|uniref:Site-specific recombinase XerD n=1 Tax=Desulfosporosinus hippei DSM 8344 TaxID=1121419 RepID=A0A1G8CI55_9FIRM|nr:hypothetical protein [Desulfosporosinus hippei]SDH45106.1 Site-specific recombinase XerD [Desulfosporosinus hippei DSM 8344]
MGKKSDISRPSRLKLMSEKNRLWFDRYINYLQGTDLGEGTIYQYSMLLIKLIEFDKDVVVDTMTFEYISMFLESSKISDNRINWSITVINNFFEYIRNHITISLDLDKLNDLRIARKSVESRKTVPLNVEEIIKIRNILKNDLKRLFIFEVVYQHGLKLDELELISPEKFDTSTGTMKLSKSKTLNFSKRINDIIQQSNKVLNKKTYSHLQEIISEIGQKVSRNLVWRDIIETRDKFFFTCSLCLSKYENTPDNWALVRHSGADDTLWIVCKECAFKGVKNE